MDLSINQRFFEKKMQFKNAKNALIPPNNSLSGAEKMLKQLQVNVQINLQNLCLIIVIDAFVMS